MTSGYLVGQDENGDPQLMPLLGSGCHLPHSSPASAPESTTYWSENVLVSLVLDTVFGKDIEATIGKVKYGVDQGRERFQAMLFSIENVVLLEVDAIQGTKIIKKTGTISIIDLSTF